jgi:hypothetical protein
MALGVREAARRELVKELIAGGGIGPGISNNGSITGTYLFAEPVSGTPTLGAWGIVVIATLLIATAAFTLQNSARS